MSAARFVTVWTATTIASFSAILWASGGHVFAPRLEFTTPLVLSPSKPEAFVHGSGKEVTGFSPSGPFSLEQFVDEKVRGTRALLAYVFRSPEASAELAEDARGPLRRLLLREPLLELHALRKDASGQAIGSYLQVRITAAQGALEVRNLNLAALDPTFPLKLGNARIELDRQGDGVFEMTLTAAEVACTIDTTDTTESALPLREVHAVGADGEPVLCVFGNDLEVRSKDWRWTPERDPLAPTNFVFGAELVAKMTSRRQRIDSATESRSILSSPRGGALRVEPPHLDAERRGWRRARFDMEHEFRIDQTLLRTDRAPQSSWIEGADAWLDLLIASEGEQENAAPREAEAPESDDMKGNARLVAARVERDLRAGGGFGELRARAATFEFAQDEENRVRASECEGPVSFRPPQSSDWIAKLFGEEGAGAIEGELELRCAGGATLKRPDDLEPTRDGHEIELRENVVLGVIGGPEVLRAGRWLRTRFEEPPAAILAQREASAQDAPKLEPRWMEADGAVRLDHQGQIADGGHLRVDFEGWGEEAKRHLVLTEAPKVRVQMDPERAPLDLSCSGPLELSLGPQGLERAKLSENVRVEPITPDPAQLHLRCAHLDVAGVGEKELSFTARGNVQYDEGDRHVTCDRLERAPTGRISVVGVPAEVAIVHNGEPVKLRALWIGYDEAQGSFYALGLARRVELEPPASLARFDVTGSSRGDAKKEPSAKGEKKNADPAVAPEAPPTSEPPAEPVRIAAQIFAAKLQEERTQVMGVFRVRVEGAVEAHADWLWARKTQTARLTLGAFAARRIELARDVPGEQVRGTARRMVWGEKDQDLRLLGRPHVRWSGTSDKGFDIVPGTAEPAGSVQTYDLRARDSMMFTERLVELHGQASVTRVDGRPFAIGGEKVTLERNLADNKPRRLTLLRNATVRIPSDQPGDPLLFDVEAHRIDWDAKTKVLFIRSDHLQGGGKRASFSFQGQPDSARYVEFDVERFVLREVRRQ
ncbi:MAG: hypothetical protein IPN34_17785 [Planctomycetes bacterium]|nr:hypothetical protein [Planctomycetota bacterium]